MAGLSPSARGATRSAASCGYWMGSAGAAASMAAHCAAKLSTYATRSCGGSCARARLPARCTRSRTASPSGKRFSSSRQNMTRCG
eukprot:11125643-Alexandrium_andersonii.AAC.1